MAEHHRHLLALVLAEEVERVADAERSVDDGSPEPPVFHSLVTEGFRIEFAGFGQRRNAQKVEELDAFLLSLPEVEPGEGKRLSG